MEEKYEDLLRRFTAGSREIFGENLTGVYLHGSAAMGCFHSAASDLDLITVVEDAPSREAKRRYLDFAAALNQEAPPKGIELSVVRRAVCRPFQYPTPYELHFSIAHLDRYLSDPEDYLVRMRGTDRDLAAHFTVILHRGRTLYGKEISEVFGAVDGRYYFDSIWRDVSGGAEEIMEDPVYVTLNLCRVLAYVREGRVLSKREGGAWGLEHLPPRYEPLVRAALAAYEAGAPLVLDGALAREYAASMLAAIQKESGYERAIFAK